jgi:hypothetical protein
MVRQVQVVQTVLQELMVHRALQVRMVQMAQAVVVELVAHQGLTVLVEAQVQMERAGQTERVEVQEQTVHQEVAGHRQQYQGQMTKY